MIKKTKEGIIALFILILIIGIAFRLALPLGSGQLYEPDNYIYLSMVQQTIANHLIIPPVDSLSGFPMHIAFGEHPGLVLIPAYLSAITSISAYNVMLALPLIMGILGMLFIYLITKELSDSPYVPLLAMFLFAIIPAAVFRTQVGEYRGETFIPVLSMIPILVLLKFKNLYALLISAIAVSGLAIWIWSGGYYIALAYSIFVILAVSYQILKSKLKDLNTVFKFTIDTPLTLIFGISSLIIDVSIVVVKNYLLPTSAGILELAPISISFVFAYFGGFTFFFAFIYFCSLIIKRNEYKNTIVLMFILAFFVTTFPLALVQERWTTLIAIPACILAALMFVDILQLLKNDKMMFYAAIAVFLIFTVWQSSVVILSSGQADAQTPAMFQALNWIKNNTSSNSTFLTIWTDGSLIEGYANRTSYTDSIQGSNITRQAGFADFLLAKAGNLTYLTQVNPDYLYVRNVYTVGTEYTSIEAEGGYPANTPINGTNLQALLNKSIDLKLVFFNNDSLIYKV